uniref:Putative uridine nucleosidase 2 n=1 Tax=Tanacetum cinerariifolium TaxID=118510 RepID=A0A699GFA7_TANCI|nr:putative uridine nucleosidase 2 [Tanacetum cinerariifolium]
MVSSFLRPLRRALPVPGPVIGLVLALALSCVMQASPVHAAERQKVIVDMDIGDDIDDAFALALLLQSPEIEIVGITTAWGDTALRAQLLERMLRETGALCPARPTGGERSGSGLHAGTDPAPAGQDHLAGIGPADQRGRGYPARRRHVRQTQTGGHDGRLGAQRLPQVAICAGAPGRQGIQHRVRCQRRAAAVRVRRADRDDAGRLHPDPSRRSGTQRPARPWLAGHRCAGADVPPVDRRLPAVGQQYAVAVRRGAGGLADRSGSLHQHAAAHRGDRRRLHARSSRQTQCGSVPGIGPETLLRYLHGTPAGGQAMSSRLVYSTETGRLCPDCGKPLADCVCKTAAKARPLGDGNVRVARESKGRGGKTVTLVRGLALDAVALAALGKQLRSACGSGGTVKDGLAESLDSRLRGNDGNGAVRPPFSIRSSIFPRSRLAQFVLLALALALDAAVDGIGNGGHRWRRVHCLESRHLFECQAQSLAFFDQVEMLLGIEADKADRHAALARAAGAADAVGVVDRRSRQVVVDHRRQARDVDAARGDVGRHQHLQAARLEVAQHLGARALAEFTVKGAGLDAVAIQLVRHVFGRVLGRDEHQHPVPLVLQDQVAQQHGAARDIDQDRALGDIGFCRGFGQHFHLRGLVQHGVGQRLHRRREGRGKEQVLALPRQQLQDAPQLFAEAQVQQAVRLVQHQHRHARNLERVMVDQVQQPSRRGNHDIGAAAQGHHLRVDRHAAKHNRHLYRHRQMRHQLAHRLSHLRRQLARGHQDQAMQLARAVAVVEQRLQQRQHEGGGFAGTGLGRAQQVLAAQDGGNGLALDGGGFLVADGGDSVDERGSEAQRRK